MKFRGKRMVRATAATLMMLVTTACMNEVDNFDNESLSSLTGSPTPNSIATASQGLFRAIRNSVVGQGSFTSHQAFFGRDGYVLDPATPGLVPETLVGPLLHSTRNDWADNYKAIQQGAVILAALNTVAGMTDPQKEAVRGFVKTVQAYAFERVIMSHDMSGAVLQIDIDPVGTTAAPIATRDQVYAHVTSLYDQAATHLAAGGTAFPFQFTPGFAGFTTPANFLRANRGLKARVDVHRATLEPGAATTHYTNALTALGLSFISTTQPLTLGIYHSFSTASGDQSNTSYDPTGRSFLGHPSIETDAQLQADGVTKDARYLAKTFKRASPVNQSNISSDIGLRVYSSNAGPVSILRNEDLILLRAEANLGLGNRALALQDINFIRTTSGSLPAIADPGDPGLFNELVYNRRYSLFYEAHRWFDMRRWGRLAQLPHDLPSHRVFSRLPLPDAECTARTPEPAGCANDNGI
jgi:hypothetical protein